MNLNDVMINELYNIKNIDKGDIETYEFLKSLGCYVGESIKVVSRNSDNLVVVVKGARYSIDNELAEIIECEA